MKKYQWSIIIFEREVNSIMQVKLSTRLNLNIYIYVHFYMQVSARQKYQDLQIIIWFDWNLVKL